MNKVIALFFTLIILSTLAAAQNNAVATFGEEKISAGEFKARFELMPHLSDYSFSIDSVKSEFLYSLIAEKIWALEGLNQQFDNSDIFKYSLLPIEKILVRDALFQKEISNKIFISNEELNRGAARSNITLKINIIASKDSTEIYKIFSDLNTGASFDSIFQLRSESPEQKFPLEITFGDIEEVNVEDTLYNMVPGTISYPLKTKNGWFIFNLKEKIYSAPTERDPDTKRTAQNIIKERKAKKIGIKYLENLLTGITIKADEKLFHNLSEKIIELLNDKYLNDSVSAKFNLNEADIINLINQFKIEPLAAPFILFEKDPVPLKEFIYHLNFTGFVTTSLSQNSIALILNNYLKIFIESELITREGFRRGLQNLQEVKDDLNKWRDNFIAQILRNRFTDSVNISQDEIEEHYNKLYKTNNPVTQVNIVEVLNSSLDIIHHILDELKKGADFKSLAGHFTEREWAKEKSGEFGFFPVTMHGEIGRIAADLEIGEIYGPLKVPEGYSLFMLIDKKEEDLNLHNSFDEIKDQLKNDLVSKKLDDKYKKYTLLLAEKYNVKINYETLKSIEVSSVNMFTYRYMGFGGRITAVPYTTPWYEWKVEWQKGYRINP